MKELSPPKVCFPNRNKGPKQKREITDFAGKCAVDFILNLEIQPSFVSVYVEFLLSKQTDKDLFHFKPLLSGTISLKLLDILHQSPH